MGGRVRGALRADSGYNDLQNAVHVFQNVVIPEPQDTVVVLGQPSIADTICFAVSVLSAIHLYNHPRFPADKIDHVGTDRLLANELAAFNRPRTRPIP
jgi:hypothetical protein